MRGARGTTARTHTGARAYKSRASGPGGYAETLDQLEAWAVELFSAIPNKDAAVPTFPGHPLSDDQLRVRRETSRLEVHVRAV